jgi:hypothetical protein
VLQFIDDILEAIRSILKKLKGSLSKIFLKTGDTEIALSRTISLPVKFRETSCSNSRRAPDYDRKKFQDSKMSSFMSIS